MSDPLKHIRPKGYVELDQERKLLWEAQEATDKLRAQNELINTAVTRLTLLAAIAVLEVIAALLF